MLLPSSRDVENLTILVRGTYALLKHPPRAPASAYPNGVSCVGFDIEGDGETSVMQRRMEGSTEREAGRRCVIEGDSDLAASAPRAGRRR